MMMQSFLSFKENKMFPLLILSNLESRMLSLRKFLTVLSNSKVNTMIELTKDMEVNTIIDEIKLEMFNQLKQKIIHYHYLNRLKMFISNHHHTLRIFQDNPLLH